MKTHRPTPSKFPASAIYWLSFIGLLGLFGLIAVPDAVMCDGDTSCIEYKQGGLLDCTVRKMAPAEVLQFWQEVDLARQRCLGHLLLNLMHATDTYTRCPPLDLKMLSLRVRTLPPPRCASG